VGLRELKNRLSEYVRIVRGGEGIQVTDRGQVVAELVPPGASAASRSPQPGLAVLEQRGLLRPGLTNRPGRYPPVSRLLPRGRLKRLLDAERADR
jgi:antitoxin (DNA-binding transcriptional repressor) of toxin-antitoxin stability system